MSILLTLVIGLHSLNGVIPDAACQKLVPVARAAMVEALRKQGATFPVPWLDDDRFWVAGRDEHDLSRCVFRWGGNPTGGGHHGEVLIDPATGRVLSITVGRHRR
ncbi:MAG: hypothetical protein ACREM3_08470 [Candidatus Rokuibacteriota bacterium]